MYIYVRVYIHVYSTAAGGIEGRPYGYWEGKAPEKPPAAAADDDPRSGATDCRELRRVAEIVAVLSHYLTSPKSVNGHVR